MNSIIEILQMAKTQIMTMQTCTACQLSESFGPYPRYQLHSEIKDGNMRFWAEPINNVGRAERLVMNEMEGQSTSFFLETHTVAQLLDAFDRAIANGD